MGYKELEDFDEAASALVVPFLKRLDETPPPDVIYHYTNAAGLRGIMQSGTVWLTDAFALNDPSEFAHGLSHAVTALQQRARKIGPTAEPFTRIFAEFQMHGVHRAIHINVASFSEDGDDLGQWRAYGDDGRGFALGFESAMLEKGFGWPNGAQSQHRGSFPVNYDATLLAQMQDEIIGKMAHLVDLPFKEGFGEQAAGEFWRDLSVLTTLHCLHLSTVFKHEAYRHEQEYRFMEFRGITTPAAGTKSRVRGNELVNYLDFDWRAEAPHALREIVIGPASDPEKARAFVDRCVTDFPPNTALSISRSSIPYRRYG
jgi:hypothetical protein